jgi:23S rRNA pseudouridine1911/1915/1917 synthase
MRFRNLQSADMTSDFKTHPVHGYVARRIGADARYLNNRVDEETAAWRDVEIALNRDPVTKRLDAHLAARFSNLSRNYFQNLIADGEVLVNGKRSKSNYRLKRGDVVTLTVPALPERIIASEPIPLDIIYEDEQLIVINKQPGIICHPGRSNLSGTLANGLVYHMLNGAENTGDRNPGIVHRLDRNTTGVMVTAKEPYAHIHLSRQFADRNTRKEYLALVRGAPPAERGRIALAIGFHPEQRELMTCRPDGIDMREAETEYEVKERLGDFTLLIARLLTGRTHQIRVHLQTAGMPIVGDPGYGKYLDGQARNVADPPAVAAFPRQALHAWRLGITHPATKNPVEFTAPLPADYAEMLDTLREAKGRGGLRK